MREQRSFFHELRRRKALHTAGLYIVVAGGLWGASDIAVDALALPPVVMRVIVLASIAGFPFAVLLSWFYEIQPETDVSDEPDDVRFRAAALVAAIVFVGVVTVGGALLVGEKSGPPSVGSDFELHKLTFSGNARLPDISPDGRFVAYIDGRDPERLMVQDVEGEEALALENLEVVNLTRVRWSPDGSEIIYKGFDDRHEWWVIPFPGAESRFLGDEANLTRSPTGDRVAVAYQNWQGFRIRDLDTGDERMVTIDAPPLWVNDLRWSPVGEWAAVVTSDQGNGENALWVVSTGEQDRQVRLAGWQGDSRPRVRWLGDGRSLYYDRGGEIWRVSIDPGTGSPEQFDGEYTGHDTNEGFGISADGTRLILSEVTTGANFYGLPIRGDSVSQDWITITEGSAYRCCGRVSPDGRKLAFVTFRDDFGRNADGITVKELPHGEERRVTDRAAWNVTWSADGDELAFVGEYQDGYRIFAIPIIGGTGRLISRTDVHPLTAIDWCVTGEILYQLPGNRDFVVLDPLSGAERQLMGNEDTGWVFEPRCSTDGSRVAMSWNHPDRPGIYTVDMADGSSRFLGDSPGTPGFWSDDGRWVYTGFQRFSVLGDQVETAFYHPTYTTEYMEPALDGTLAIMWSLESSVMDLHLVDYRDPDFR